MSSTKKEYFASNMPLLSEEEGGFNLHTPYQQHQAQRRGIRSIFKGRIQTYLCLSFISFVFVCFIYQSEKISSIVTSMEEKSTEEGWTTIIPQKVSLPYAYQGPYTANEVNSTFGFGKIFVLHLPHRSDKKDQLLMMSRTQGIDLTFVTTRTPDLIKQSGMPWMNEVMEKSVGKTSLYRGHMDAMQAILDNNLRAGLILEDDSDWDVDVKYALQQLHQPFATLVNSFRQDPSKPSIPSTKEDPWLSTEWDVLNFGSCLDDPFTPTDNHGGKVDASKPPFVSYEDRTFDDTENGSLQHFKILQGYNQSIPTKDKSQPQPHFRRLATLSNRPVCMNGYAVSRKGAIKSLYHLSRGIVQPFDLTYANLVKTEKIRSWSVSPPIMSQWKIKNAGMRNSDKDAVVPGSSTTGHDAGRFDPWIGFSTSIKNSTRAFIRDRVEIDLLF